MPSLSDLIPESPKERTKFFVVVGIFAVVMIWLIYYMATSINFGGGTRELDTPGWRLVQELNAKLNEDPEFMDAGFAVETEKPLKFKVVGAVHTPRELERLRERLKEIRPEGDYELEVEIIPR